MESSFTESHVEHGTEDAFPFAESEVRNSCQDSTFAFENESRNLATPFTQITEKVCRPDLAIYCEPCDEYVNAKILSDHRLFHSSLNLFHYNFVNLPISTDRVLLRRNTLLRKIKRENGFQAKKKSHEEPKNNKNLVRGDLQSRIKEVNKAYELLKSLIDDSYEQDRQVNDLAECKVLSYVASSKNENVKLIAICSSKNERWKNSMEDRHCLEDCFGGDYRKLFFGVFDGYNGYYASELASKEFHRLILSKIAKFDDAVVPPEASIADAYYLNCPPRPPTTDGWKRQLYQQSVHIMDIIQNHCSKKLDDFLCLQSTEQQELFDVQSAADLSCNPHDTVGNEECVVDTIKSSDPDEIIKSTCVIDNEKSNTFEKKNNDNFTLQVDINYGDNILSVHGSSLLKSKRLRDVQKTINSDKVYFNYRNSLDNLINIPFNNVDDPDIVYTDLVSSGVNDKAIVQAKSTYHKKLTDKGVPESKLRCSKNMADAYHRVYHLIDSLLGYGVGEESKARWSGTSAATIILESIDGEESGMKMITGINNNSRDQPQTSVKTKKPSALLHIANAGNVQAILVKNNVAQKITREHTCHNEKEAKRIINSGGKLNLSTADCRVNGILATTRGLGNHGDPLLKHCVIADPYTKTIPIDDSAQMIVIASNGLWEIFNEHEVADILLKILPNNHVPAPERIHSSLQSLYSSKSRQPSATSSKLVKKSSVALGSYNTKTSLRQHIANDRKLTVNSKILVKSDDTNSTVATSIRKAHEIDVILRRRSQVSGSCASVDEQRKYVATWMAEDLVQAALLAGAKENITVMIILLDGCDI